MLLCLCHYCRYHFCRDSKAHKFFFDQGNFSLQIQQVLFQLGNIFLTRQLDVSRLMGILAAAAAAAGTSLGTIVVSHIRFSFEI
jgi:hypothetical protein